MTRATRLTPPCCRS